MPPKKATGEKEKRVREPDSPETRRQKNARARERREAKRGGPASNPAERGHISNPKIYAALLAAGKPKQMAAGAANKHPNMEGAERQAYIKKKIAEGYDQSKISKRAKK